MIKISTTKNYCIHDHGNERQRGVKRTSAGAAGANINAEKILRHGSIVPKLGVRVRDGSMQGGGL